MAHENRLIESYRYGLKLAKIYSRKFECLGKDMVSDIALDLAVKYKDWIDKPGCVLTTAMSREMFFKCCDAVKRKRIETKFYKPESIVNEETHLHFQKLTSEAELLLEHLKEAGTSNWNFIMEILSKKGWTYSKAKNRTKELRRKYLGSSNLLHRDPFIETVKPGKNGCFFSKQKKESLCS
jgi:hypothetical protein